MYTLDICIDDVITELKKNHRVPNKNIVKRAYNYANEMHKNQKRKSGEAYIMHSLRVARMIARWGFESDVICAALLHDVVEDTSATLDDIIQRFDSNIADMVDTVTAIKVELDQKDSLTKEEVDKLSDIRLREKMSEKALFIKAADRLDNLRTIDVFEESKQIAKAVHTREVLLPMLSKEGAYRLVDKLEEECLKIEHPARYQKILSRYTSLREKNAFTTKKTLSLFSQVFSPNNKIASDECQLVLQNIVDFFYTARSSVSIYRQINAQAEDLEKDMDKLLCKKNIAIYDLTLVISDDYCANASAHRATKNSPTSAFFKLYSNLLADQDITILDYNYTTYKDSRYYILSDGRDNLYRLFIKSETEYMRYRLGHIVDSEDITDFTNTANEANKIKVFKKDRTSMYIDEGSSMLDFAFAIHSDIGLHFDYALIDGSLTQHKEYDRICPGDVITVVPNPDVKPSIQWFRYVKTSKAIDHLVKYFEQQNN